MRKCEFCGEEFDVIDTQNAFDYITELSYLKVKPDLCFTCAVQAVDFKMKGVYFETCDCCGKKCFLQVQIPEICRQKWRILHLRFGESCRLPGRIA